MDRDLEAGVNVQGSPSVQSSSIVDHATSELPSLGSSLAERISEINANVGELMELTKQLRISNDPTLVNSMYVPHKFDYA
jgi:hypothetical protein